MAQFPMTDSRRKILERIPDYAVTTTPSDKTITVTHAGITLAQSKRSLLVQETRHNDVYYLPIGDISLDLFELTEHTTYCPFKGHASYYSFCHDETLANVLWTYRTPYPEVTLLEGYASFYTNRVTQLVT